MDAEVSKDVVSSTFLYKTTQYHILESYKLAVLLYVVCGCKTSLQLLENRVLRIKVGL